MSLGKIDLNPQENYKSTMVSLGRLGLCFFFMVIVDVYVTAAVEQRMKFYLPIGIIVMIVYGLSITFIFKRIYPKISITFRQLSITSLIGVVQMSVETPKVKAIYQANPTEWSLIPYATASGKGYVYGASLIIALVIYLASDFIFNKKATVKDAVKPEIKTENIIDYEELKSENERLKLETENERLKNELAQLRSKSSNTE